MYVFVLSFHLGILYFTHSYWAQIIKIDLCGLRVWNFSLTRFQRFTSTFHLNIWSHRTGFRNALGIHSSTEGDIFCQSSSYHHSSSLITLLLYPNSVIGNIRLVWVCLFRCSLWLIVHDKTWWLFRKKKIEIIKINLIKR